MAAVVISHPARGRAWLQDHPALLTLALLLLVLVPPAGQYTTLVAKRIGDEGSALADLRRQIEGGQYQEASRKLSAAYALYDGDQVILLGHRPPELQQAWAEAMLAMLGVATQSSSVSAGNPTQPIVSRAVEEFRALSQTPGFQETGLAGLKALSFAIPPASAAGQQLRKQVGVYEPTPETPQTSLASPTARSAYFASLAKAYMTLNDFNDHSRALNQALSLQPSGAATVRPLTLSVAIDDSIDANRLTLTLTMTDGSVAPVAIDGRVGSASWPSVQFADQDTPTLVRLSWTEPAPGRPRPVPHSLLVPVRAGTASPVNVHSLLHDAGNQVLAPQGIPRSETASPHDLDALADSIQLGLDANSRPVLRDACWSGTLYGMAAIARRACDALGAPMRLDEGMALALNDGLTGDSTSAGEVLQRALALPPSTAASSQATAEAARRTTAQAWLTRLEAGEDPFDAAAIATQRKTANPFALPFIGAAQNVLDP